MASCTYLTTYIVYYCSRSQLAVFPERTKRKRHRFKGTQKIGTACILCTVKHGIDNSRAVCVCTMCNQPHSSLPASYQRYRISYHSITSHEENEHLQGQSQSQSPKKKAHQHMYMYMYVCQVHSFYSDPTPVRYL